MTEDASLLRCFAETADQAAFAELVRRHLPLVYHAALRQVGGDAHLAEDVAQTVFADLARKACCLTDRPVLSGWLYTSTSYAAAKAVRTERRRRRREQEAQTMHEMTAAPEPAVDWDRLRPVLDAAMGELSKTDREAVLLRYFEQRGYAEIGQQLALSENTARMRVERALDKLHGLLARRGLPSTTAALAAALANQALAAVPAGLGQTVTSAALSAAATGGGAALFALMSTAKVQLSVAAALVAAGTIGLVVQNQANARLERELATLSAQTADLAQVRADRERLAQAAADADRLRSVEAELKATQAEATSLYAQYQTAQAARKPAAPSSAQAKSTSGKVYTLAELDQAPKLTQAQQPSYPYALLSFGISGVVQVDYVVGADGTVSDASVVSSTHSAFEEAALAAVASWQFEPGAVAGTPVNVRVRQVIKFSYNSANSRWF